MCSHQDYEKFFNRRCIISNQTLIRKVFKDYNYYFSNAISATTEVYMQAFHPKTATTTCETASPKCHVQFNPTSIADFVYTYNNQAQIYFMPCSIEILEKDMTNVLCLDIDAKDRFTEDYSIGAFYSWGWSIVDHLTNAVELGPNLVVNSGSGLHVYYYLKEPISFEDARMLYREFPVVDLDGRANCHQNSYWRGLPLTFNHSYDPPRRRKLFKGNSGQIYTIKTITGNIAKYQKKPTLFPSITIPKDQQHKKTIVATEKEDWQKVIEEYCEKSYWLNEVYHKAYFMSLRKQGLMNKFRDRGDRKPPRHDRSWCENRLLFAMVEADVPEEYFFSILKHWRYGRGGKKQNNKWRELWISKAIPKAKVWAFLKLSQRYCSLREIARNTDCREDFVKRLCLTEFKKSVEHKWIRKKKLRQLCFRYIKSRRKPSQECD